MAIDSAVTCTARAAAGSWSVSPAAPVDPRRGGRPRPQIGDELVTGVLYDNPVADQIVALLPFEAGFDDFHHQENSRA